jgi:tetratricopeptide (TPR) repeat protein
MRTESQRPQREQAPDSTETFSVIRYTRLLDSARSIAILDDYKQNPLLDLELLRRRLETLPPTRAAAEVWLLLGRHPEEEALFEWAAWYFDHQKLFDETARLVKDAARKGMAGSWTDLHRSFALLREGKIFEGEKLLRDVYARETSFQGAGNRNADWRIPANLGRIQESRRAIPAALELYEAAAALIAGQRPAENAAAALVQTRLSRCLEALGRIRESRRALEYAAELDPTNLNIRRELRRFDAR